MPRRCCESPLNDEPPKKKPHLSSQQTNANLLKTRECLKDLTGKEWKIGETIGIGGFGEICLASEVEQDFKTTICPYVAKIEKHENGPLFVEINCYLRIGRLEMIKKWMEEKRLSSLGMPYYVASGSYKCKNQRYRFLILPKYEKDLEKILEEKIKLNLKTVLTISCQILDVLEYIHSKGYIHSDIKASNILLNNFIKQQSRNSIRKNRYKNPVRTCRLKRKPSVRNLRTLPYINYDDNDDGQELIDDCDDEHYRTLNVHNNNDQVYLSDYGLACRYLSSNGEHKPFSIDERRAHAGTLLFCSRDAHKGVQSRRSDLESLGYNIIYWLTGNLPWLKECDPEVVEKMKLKALQDPKEFLKICFNEYPKFLLDLFNYLQNLKFHEKPDYNYMRTLFKNTIKQYGYKDDSRFDFDNLEGWGQKQKKLRTLQIKHISCKFLRPPLRSNIPQLKPLLRKKAQDKKLKRIMRWSQILLDPENILRQAKRSVETNNENTSVTTFTTSDLKNMNPTQAMIEVFNKSKEREDTSPTYRSDCNLNNIDGYTPAMMSVWKRMQERQILELELNDNVEKSARRVRPRRRKYECVVTLHKSSKSTVKIQDTLQVRQMKNDWEQRRKKSNLIRAYSLRG